MASTWYWDNPNEELYVAMTGAADSKYFGWYMDTIPKQMYGGSARIKKITLYFYTQTNDDYVKYIYIVAGKLNALGKNTHYASGLLNWGSGSTGWTSGYIEPNLLLDEYEGHYIHTVFKQTGDHYVKFKAAVIEVEYE
jgi:hypothetical protein